MTKITFLLIFFFCMNTYAITEKAYIVFTAGLNDIDNKKTGGYAELASLLDTKRKTNTPTFFIFGGASLFPSILSSFDHGTHIIDLLNSLEPDAMAVSKGDFTFSADELSLRTYEAAFPIVQSNMEEIATKRNLDGLLDSVIMQQGPYKFGFISIMDNIDIETYNFTGVKVNPPRSVIENEAQKLREQGADFIIMHYRGDELNSIDFLNDGTVDLVLRKNSHLELSAANKLQKHPKQIFLTEADQVAVIELSWQKKHRKSLTVQWQASLLSSYPKNQHVQRQIDSYTSQLNLLLDEVIGITTTELDTTRLSLRTKENALGGLVADLMKKHAEADIALINGGAFRGDHFYPQNSKITRRDILKILPYRNKVVLLDISGEQLTEALENGFSQLENMKGRFPQVSGIKVIYDSQAEAGQRVVSVRINNNPLEPLTRYKLATIDYLAEGGDGYSLFKHSKPLAYNQQMSKLLSDIFCYELKLASTISARIENRIVDAGKRATELQ